MKSSSTPESRCTSREPRPEGILEDNRAATPVLILLLTFPQANKCGVEESVADSVNCRSLVKKSAPGPEGGLYVDLYEDEN